MAKKVLIVIDMQNDFVDGSLGTKEAQAIAANVVSKAKNFDGEVIFTRDTHGEDYMETQEGKFLPVKHCICGTKGWEVIPELEAVRRERGAHCYDKPTFGSVRLAQDLKEEFGRGELESVELIGVCTDICVISNALLIKANMPELTVAVDAVCCAGVTPGKHEAALETMRSCQVVVAG